MKFTSYDLGTLNEGRVVEIVLQGNAVNVQLLDSANFQNFKASKEYHYIGGLTKQSPVYLQTTHRDHWYITLDFRGLQGSVKSTVRVVPASLPSMQQKAQTFAPATTPNLERGNVEKKGWKSEEREPEYDVSVFYVSEDKNEVAWPLVEALEKMNCKVWYDKLDTGGTTSRSWWKIDRYLSNSRLGIVIVSGNFIRKSWTSAELEEISQRGPSGTPPLLPLFHRVTKAEILSLIPSLAEQVGKNNTAVQTVQEIAVEAFALVRQK